MTSLALVFDLIGKDSASPAFLKASAAADKAAASTARASKTFGGAAASMGVVGKKLTKAVTLPLLGIAAVSVDQAAKYQKAMNTIGTATDQTQKQLAGSSKGLLTIAKSTGTSLSQLTDALYVVEKSGVRGAAALDTVKAAAQGAKAEGADLGTATQALTNIMASYGKSLGTPVQAENALIRGAGLAKTTYQDFAASLANVVPVAAALHISFAQVAGAVDTMTQHGETAQRATDNLSNLITNLAGQNNVASKSLQQLGVNTIDLSKNLGARGLTGSLNTVLAAIGKHSKDGLVVTSAFKQAAIATQSLGTELDALPKSMQTNARAFVSGKMSYLDFYRYTKSLGGQQFALGKDLITTQRAASGFNDQLKSGNTTTQTLARTLQKALGGVTGMRVALMLSGVSAKQFSTSVDAVSKAAKTSGADVLGWAATSGTLAVKMDKAKESLQVLAVEIGTKLIPVVTKIAGAVGDAVNWFSNLSHTDKEIIGWSAVTLAALGPIMSIGSRIGLAAGGLVRFAGVSTTTASTVASSMAKISTALIGAGIAYAGIQKGGQTGGIMAGLGGGLTGAAIGSFFGPVGTALGGLTGAVVGMGLAYAKSGDQGETAGQRQAKAAQAARQAIQQQAAAVDALTTSIQNDSGAIGANTRAQIANDLQKSGALKLAQQLNINPALLTGAAAGSASDKAKLGKKLQGITTKNVSLVGANGSVLTDVTKLNAKLAAEGIILGKAGAAADLHAEAIGKLSLATRSAANQTAYYGTTLGKETIAGRANIKFIGDHVTALDTQLSKGKLTNVQWAEQIGTLQAQLKQYGFNTSAVAAYSAGFAKIPKSVVTKLLANPLIANSMIGEVLRGIGKVPKSHNTKLNATDGVTPKATAISGIIDSLTGKNLPIHAIDYASAPLLRIRDIIASLHSKSVTITTYQAASIAGTIRKVDHLPGSAGGSGWGPGGKLPPGLSTVGERGWELADTDASGRTSIVPHGASVAMTGIRGFAAGTAPGKTYSFGGQQYASLRAEQNAETRAGIAAQKAAARTRAATAKANATLGAKIRGVDTTGLMAALGKTVDQIKTAFRAIIADLGKAGYSPSALHSITSKADALLTKQAKLSTELGVQSTSGTTALDKLSAAVSAFNSTASTVASAVSGTFDINATPANPLDGLNALRATNNLAPLKGDPFANIMRSLGGDVNDAKSFRSGLAKLHNEGLSDALYDQLAEKGTGSLSTVKTLLTGSKSDIGRLSAQYGQLNSIGAATGHDVAKVVNGAALTHDKEVVAELRAAQAENTRLLKQLIAATTRVGGDVGAHLGGATNRGVLKARTTPVGHR